MLGYTIMSLVEKIKSVLFHPGKFFENLKKEKGFKTAFTYYLILSFFSLVMGIIVTRTFNNYMYGFWNRLYGMNLPVPAQSLELLVVFPFIWYLVSILLSFVISGLLHVWILIFGGKEDYSKTYQLYIYSGTPGYIFGWIPFVAFFAWLYSIALLILGTQKVHGISKNRAILMYVIPLVLFVIFMIVCMIIMLMFIAANPGLFQNLTSNYTQ
jgi:hypothetical protein